MTPTEFWDRVEIVLQEGFRMLLVLLVALAIYLIFVGFAMAIECRERPGDSKTYWSYRIIDGERCWYRGEGRKPKSSLHWPDEPKPKPVKGDPLFQIRASLPAPPDKNPAVKDADKEDRANDPPTRRGRSSTLNAVTWHMARPFDQATPINPPLLYNPADVPEPECCWPDLSEFDRRFVGVQP